MENNQNSTPNFNSAQYPTRPSPSTVSIPSPGPSSLHHQFHTGERLLESHHHFIHLPLTVHGIRLTRRGLGYNVHVPNGHFTEIRATGHQSEQMSIRNNSISVRSSTIGRPSYPSTTSMDRLFVFVTISVQCQRCQEERLMIVNCLHQGIPCETCAHLSEIHLKHGNVPL